MNCEFGFDFDNEFLFLCEFDFDFDCEFEFLFHCEFDFDFDYEFKFWFHCEFDFDFDCEFEFLYHFEFDFDFDCEFEFLFKLRRDALLLNVIPAVICEAPHQIDNATAGRASGVNIGVARISDGGAARAVETVARRVPSFPLAALTLRIVNLRPVAGDVRRRVNGRPIVVGGLTNVVRLASVRIGEKAGPGAGERAEGAAGFAAPTRRAAGSQNMCKYRDFPLHRANGSRGISQTIKIGSGVRKEIQLLL
ncbi:unnamed protein product [Nesidiocoris tenuis]|uniref:Uncharacterized protein n=1 Tax=Nesidiocoris tenuis TaxID=355587 RepID=A0A6H5GM08_9HEMI|nr:unnamed protein product [Nesidiocoris tenuis]